MGERAYEIAVVGGGAAGSATAWALARRGVSVVLLEREGAGSALPETGDEQIVRLAHPDAAYVRLAQGAHAWWATLGAESGEELLTPVASVEHGPVRAVRPVTEALLACGAPFEYLTGPEAAERWPGMRFDDRVIVQPSAARVDARRTVALLQQQAAAHGAHVRHGARVLAVEATEDGARVRVAGGVTEDGYTPEHELEVGAVVVTAGAGTAALVEGVPGLEHLPEIRVARTVPARFAARDASLRGEAWVSFTHHVDVAAHAEARGTLGSDEGYPSLAVDGRHVPGVGAVVGHRVPPAGNEGGADDGDGVGGGHEVLRAYVDAWLPGLDPDRVEPVTRLTTTTPDGGFLVDRVGPVVVGAGFGGDGAALAPALGQLLADLAAGPAEALDGAPDVAAFSLARFVPVDA